MGTPENTRRADMSRLPMLSVYLDDFDLTIADLTGKRILDVGAGMRMFAKEALSVGIWPVISLDANQAVIVPIRHMFRSAPGRAASSPELTLWQRVDAASVIGLARHLPFGNDTFDRVLSRLAVPHGVDDPAEVADSLAEMTRVVRPGGTVHLFPGLAEFWEREKIQVVSEILHQYADHPDFSVTAREHLVPTHWVSGHTVRVIAYAITKFPPLV